MEREHSPAMFVSHRDRAVVCSVSEVVDSIDVCISAAIRMFRERVGNSFFPRELQVCVSCDCASGFRRAGVEFETRERMTWRGMRDGRRGEGEGEREGRETAGVQQGRRREGGRRERGMERWRRTVGELR
jgi:hypothetical protein